ncbi:type I polyketide synthase, partial [Streptomyces sp. NPDC002920]
AVINTYGRGRDTDRPLWLGSLKSNIGHTQAAAGVAGVIKAVLALRHGVLPRTLHVDEPTPHVDWSAGTVRLLDEARPWPETGRPRRAGVSAFGVSGTNAHVIVEQTREEPEQVASGGGVAVPWVLSARTPTALARQARRLAAHAEAHPELDAVALGRALATTRTAMEHRAVLIGAGRDELLDGARRLAAGEPSPLVVTGRVTDGQLAFLFSGQGSQRVGMGRELHARHPEFAEAYDAVCAELDERLPRPLREVVFADAGSEDARLLERTEFTQPALFAFEVALYRLLTSWGAEPDLVAGHSVGEIAAAHVAGVLSLADAAALVSARAGLMQSLTAPGAMVAVRADEEEVATLLSGHEHEVSIAAVNGPSAVVISGARDRVLEIAGGLRASGRRTKRLQVSHAFHSPLMDPVLEEFARVTRGLSYGVPRVPVVSNVTGRPAEGDDLVTPEYWVRHVRATVRFRDTLRTLRAEGVRTFLEVGPGDTLAAMVHENVTGAVEAVPSVRRDHEESRSVRGALAALHVGGRSLTVAPHPRHVPLPTYPFERKRYWLERTVVPQQQNTTTPTETVPEPEEAERSLVERLAERPAEERRKELIALVVGLAATALSHENTDEFDEDTGFFDLGFSSLTAVEVRNSINRICGLDTNPMLLFDHPTPGMLADHLAELMFTPQAG